MNHFNLHALPSVVETVRWHNALQELAETTPHGIPLTLSAWSPGSRASRPMTTSRAAG